jgi:hypothetical protein
MTMAVTDEEKRLARAYNIGYTLSSYEPRLLDKMIKSNPNNEFVKAMQVGRDHHQFHAGIPRKDLNREFKNGYYNGRTLAEHDPEMINRLKGTKGINKNYKNGLEAAQKEYAIRSIQQKINEEPKVPAKELRRDESFQKGFNIGYRFAGRTPMVINYSKHANERYGKYLDGMQAGKAQYDHDLGKLREKNPNAQIFKDDPQTSVFVNELTDHKIIAMDEISGKQHKVIERRDSFQNVPAPKWLNKKEQPKIEPALQKKLDKGLDMDI